MNPKATSVSGITFPTEISPEAETCNGSNVPMFGKVTLSVHGKLPIKLDTANGYRVWIVGKVKLSAYQGDLPTPVTFTVKPGGKSIKGTLLMIFNYMDPSAVTLDAEFDECTVSDFALDHK